MNRIILIGLLVASFLTSTFGAVTRIGSEALQTLPAEANYSGQPSTRPGDGDTVTLNPPIFSWFQFPEAQITTIVYTVDQFYDYQFQIDDDADFSSPVVDVRTKANFYNTLAPLTAGTTYHWRVGYYTGGTGSPAYDTTKTFTVSPSATSWDRSMLADSTYLANKAVHPRMLITSTNRAALATWAATNTLNSYSTFITRKNNALAAAYWTDTTPWATNGPTGGGNGNLGTYTLGIGSVLTYWAMSNDSSLTNGLVANYERLLDYYLASHYEFEDYGGSGADTWVVQCVALGYDWLYNILSSGQKTKAVECLQRTARFYNRNAFWTTIALTGGWIYETDAYPNAYTETRLAPWYNSQRRGTSHQWLDISAIAFIGAIAYDEGGDLRELYDNWINYMIARGHFTGGFAAIHQGRGYTSIGLHGIGVTLSMYNALFPEANLKNIPWVNGFVDWFSRMTPPGYRGGHGVWSDGADNAAVGFTDYWNNKDLRHLAMFTQDGNAWQARENGRAITGNSASENYFYEFPICYSMWPPPTQTTNTTARVFLEDGYAIAQRTYGANDINAFTNDMGFVFAARPRGCEGGHSVQSDGVAEFWAYGAKLTDGGAYNLDAFGYRPLAQDTILINGQGMQVNESYAGYSSEQILPYYARITAWRTNANYAYVQGDMTYTFQNLYNPQRTNNPTWKRSIFFSKTGKYFAIFDELTTAAASRFDFLWHVRETNAIANLSATGMNYFTTNQYSTSTSVRITNYLAFMTSGLTYTNATGGDVLVNQVTGTAYSNGGDPYRRANALWFRNSSNASSQKFFAVLCPQGVGKAAPVITRIDDLTAQIVYDGTTETLSFDSANTTATYIVDLSQAGSEEGGGGGGGGTASVAVSGKVTTTGRVIFH